MRILILFTLVYFVSCGTSKKLKPVPDRSEEEVLKSILSRNIDFEWFNAKMSTSLESPDENVSGTMHIKMKKGLAILVAVKKFGIEAARVFINKNDYTILYRLESAYESGPISQIKQIASITAEFEDIQQLMFGNVILPDDSQRTMVKDSIYYVIKSRSPEILLEYYVNGYNLQLEKMKITDKMNRTAIAEYGDYKKIDNFGYLPFYRKFYFPYSDTETASMQIEISSIEINVPADIKFSIPPRYEKIN
jgi:hypothetical protein